MKVISSPNSHTTTIIQIRNPSLGVWWGRCRVGSAIDLQGSLLMGFLWSKLTGGTPVVEVEHVASCNSANSDSGSSADSAAGPAPTRQEARRLIELLEGGKWEGAPPPPPRAPEAEIRPRRLRSHEEISADMWALELEEQELYDIESRERQYQASCHYKVWSLCFERLRIA